MKNALVVDDDPDIVNLLRTILVSQGYNVLTAYSASEAFRALLCEECAVIITDFCMPEFNPHDFVRLARSRKIPLIMLSGVVDFQQVRKNLDVALFLKKPFDPQDVVTAISLVQVS